MSANQAHAKVNPGVAGFHAVFTDMLGWFFKLDLIEMSASGRH
jgi:hypothetical protein